jgi:RHS repeat-associated protein
MRRLALLVLLTPCIVFAQPAERQVVIAISEPTPARPNPRLPDVARAGGRVQTRWQNLYLIALPNASVPAAITGWRRDEHVRFVQKIWDGESLESWNTAAGPRRETTATETTQPDGTLLWSSGIYSYDGSGNIKSIGSDSYRYDAVGRITRSTLNGSTEEYGYDGFGNLTSKYVVGETSALPAASPGTNQIAAATYDAAGNLTQHGSFTYAYDAAGMMTYENAAFGPTRHIYTADDERIMMVQGAPPHLSAHITIRDFAGRVQRRWHEPAAGWPWVWTEDYIYREDRVAARAREAGDGERGFLHLDHLGSVRLITDINGTKLARHDYYPFGTEQTSLHQEYHNFGYNPERVKFTSHERDYNGAPVAHDHSYLDYMHARFYSPKWGRFLSVDPHLDQKRASANPQGWNRYSYVENRPLTHTDPTGRAV